MLPEIGRSAPAFRPRAKRRKAGVGTLAPTTSRIYMIIMSPRTRLEMRWAGTACPNGACGSLCSGDEGPHVRALHLRTETIAKLAKLLLREIAGEHGTQGARSRGPSSANVAPLRASPRLIDTVHLLAALAPYYIERLFGRLQPCKLQPWRPWNTSLTRDRRRHESPWRDPPLALARGVQPGCPRSTTAP